MHVSVAVDRVPAVHVSEMKRQMKKLGVLLVALEKATLRPHR